MLILFHDGKSSMGFSYLIVVIFPGPKNRVDSFIRWVKRGPGLSQIVRVDNIEFQTELSADILAQQIPFLEKLLTKR